MKRFLPVVLLLLALLLVFAPGMLPMFSKEGEAGVVRIDRKIDAEALKGFDQKIVLLFFGYVGCRDVCTPMLNDIARIYRKIPKNLDVKVLFVNVDPRADALQEDQFAGFFQDDFSALHVSDAMRQRLMRECDVYATESMSEQGAFDHTSYLFALKRHDDGYHLRRIFIHAPLQDETVIRELQAL